MLGNIAMKKLDQQNIKIYLPYSFLVAIAFTLFAVLYKS
jgi:hypothetical protein